MNIVFATTNKRKIEDLSEIIQENNLDIQIFTLNDIDFHEEIEETGTTLEENSLIKAHKVYTYCIKNNLNYPVLADDAGLFIDALNGEPGIYTARYAEKERKENPQLPKYQNVIKVLDKLKGIKNRNATYRCIVTCMYPDGTYFQISGESRGKIADQMKEPIKKPYFYSIFCLENENRTFNQMKTEELKGTYRYQAMQKVLTRYFKHKN